MPQIDPQALATIRASAQVAAAHGSEATETLLRIGGAAGKALSDDARSLGLADARGRLGATRTAANRVTSYLRNLGADDAGALAGDIDQRFELLDRALATGSFGSVDKPGPSRVLVFDTATALQGDLQRAHEGIEGLTAVGGLDAARGAGLVGSGTAGWETDVARSAWQASAVDQARQAASLLDDAVAGKSSDETSAAVIDGAIARLQQAAQGLAPTAGSATPHADTARAIVLGASRGNVRGNDIAAMRSLARGIADAIDAAPAGTRPVADTALRDFVQATATSRIDALDKLGAGTLDTTQVTAASRTVRTLAGLLDGSVHLAPAERRTDISLVHAAARDGIGLYADEAVPEVVAAARRVLDSLGTAKSGASAADSLTNAGQVELLEHAGTDLDAAMGAWDEALNAATKDADGTGSSAAEFREALGKFANIIKHLHRAAPNIEGAVPKDALLGFEDSLTALDTAVFHMQMIADGTGQLGTSVWPKFGELGRVKGSIQSARMVAEMALEQAKPIAALDPTGAATDVLGASGDAIEGLVSTASRGAAATVLDPTLPFHQVREDQVGAYLAGSALKQTVVHRTQSTQSWSDIVENGPDVLHRVVNGNVFGKAFYTSFTAQTNFGANEVRLAVNTPRVAEFNSKRAFDDYVRGANVNGGAPDEVRDLFLGRGYGAAVVNQSNYNDAYVMVYDMSGARVVVDAAGKPA